MEGLNTLFDNRSVVGARLESLLSEREYTKSGFCKECGISRPTLDKILTGTIGSESHYEKHMRKILDCLSITPDVLVGNVPQARSRTRQIRSLLHIAKEEIAEAIGISVSRLEEIEAGAAISNAELRDLAVYFGTSSHCILAQNVFCPQTTGMSDLVGKIEDEDAELSGFWGHLGILPTGSTQYSWYPITSYEAGELHYTLEGERAVIPCMDNKLLYLNLRQIKSIVLLDDACDAPYYYNWDPSVGEGEIPLVVYEVLEDYVYDSGENVEIAGDEYSPMLRKLLNNLIEERKWTEDTAHKLVSGIKIRYADGSVVENDIDAGASTGYGLGEDIIDAVEDLYTMGEIAKTPKYLGFTDWNGAVNYVNTEEVAVVELPLVEVERGMRGRED